MTNLCQPATILETSWNNEMQLFEEYESILMEMVEYHSIFYKLWSITSPQFSNTIPTACVYFDSNGKEIIMEFNEEFWNSLTKTQKKFVICHETLHMLLSHGRRTINDKRVAQLINVCQDIVINERLIAMYGFKRTEIDPNNKYCWVDTVFKDNPESISTTENFEYYFNLLFKMDSSAPDDKGEGTDSGENSGGLPCTVDDHSKMGDFGDINDIGDILSEEEKEHINDFIEACSDPNACVNEQRGSEDGKLVMTLNLEKVKKKKKWETVIKKWTNKFIKQTDVDIEQWAMMDRRWTNLSSDLILPSEYELDDLKEDFNKIDVWFFQDTSGSCVHLAKRFFAAARSLPENRFNVRMFCFDTKVYETDLTSGKLYGFGGTSFNIIENKIQKICKDENINPKKVFPWVITDGYGNNVSPQYPKNWYWFLSSNYRRCIPNECNIFNLKDYE